MRRRTFGIQVLSAVACLLVASCGNEATPIAFDTTAPPTTPASTTVDSAPTVITTAPRPTLPDDLVGDSWEDATGDLAGLASECGNLSYVSNRPDSAGVIAGVALQGLWSSEDGGVSWSRLGTGEGSDPVTLRLTDVVFDPADPAAFWISGLYNGAGSYHTADDGTTFQELASPASLEDISVDFTDPQRQTLVTLRHESLDVFQSGDGGKSWHLISGTLPDEGGFTVAVEVIDADTYLVGMRLSPVPGIFRTEDAGATWTRVFTSDVAGEPLRASDGALYWLIGRGAGLATSTDDGLTWSVIPTSSISPFTVSLLELPDGRFVTVSDNTLITSDDRGISWRPVGPALPYDPNGLTYSASDKAFYVWRADCGFGEANPVRAGAIMRLAFEPAAV